MQVSFWQDHSLTISGSEPRDTGTYTCVVSNDLDSANSSARLVVTGESDMFTWGKVSFESEKKAVWLSYSRCPLKTYIFILRLLSYFVFLSCRYIFFIAFLYIISDLLPFFYLLFWNCLSQNTLAWSTELGRTSITDLTGLNFGLRVWVRIPPPPVRQDSSPCYEARALCRDPSWRGEIRTFMDLPTCSDNNPLTFLTITCYSGRIYCFY